MRRGSRRLSALLMALVFFAAGVFLIVLGFQNSKQQKTFTETTAVITRIEREPRAGSDREYDYHVFVKYTVGGKEYENELGEYSSSFKEGAAISIKYDPANPNNIIAAAGTFRTVMFIMGTVAIISSLVLALKTIRGY